MRYLAAVNPGTTSLLVGCVALACAAPPERAPAPAVPAAPISAPASAAPSAPAASATPASSVPAPAPARLEVAKASKDDQAHVEILFPFAEQRILIPKAPGYTIRTKIEGWPLGAEGRGVLIALDQHRPRRVLPKTEVKLGTLLDAGSELSPGPHWLFLAAVDAAGGLVRGGGSRAPFAMLRFWVGERDPKRAPEPRVALLAPAGTYNGEGSAGSIPVDFLAAPERLGEGGARVRVTGPGVQLDQRLDAWQPLALRHLPSGDFAVEVTLLDARGEPREGSRATRVVSVNRELGGAKNP